MFNPSGGFPGPRPRPPAHPRMIQPLINHSRMNLPGMNLQSMNTSGMSNQGLGLSGMNHPVMGMKQPGMNFPRMNQPGLNPSGMGFRPEMKSSGIGLRPLGMDPPGSFMGGNKDPIGLKGMPLRAPMHAIPERGHLGFQPRFNANPTVRPGQPRMQTQNQISPGMNVMGKPHPPELLIGKDKIPLQGPALNMGKEQQWKAPGTFGNVPQGMAVKPLNPPQVDQRQEHQNRYTTESASSILQSFGLSNEDLEELSRYPDDQLTPQNMPVILRDIRLRKMNRSVSTPDQGDGRRQVSEVLPSKVIDYGHSSKFQFSEDRVSIRDYDPPRMEEKHPLAQANLDAKKPNVAKNMVTTPKNQTDAKNPVESNKIPTISGTRKPVRQTSNLGRVNNKTIIGEQPSTVKPEVPSPVISSAKIASHPETSTITRADLPIATCPDAQIGKPPEGQTGTLVSQPYQPAPETPPTWSTFGKIDVQKMKKQPTPSMMNDYYAASPRIFPHICSLCNIECKHLKDWIRHQNTTAHIESCRQLRQQYPDWNPQVLSSLRNEGKTKDSSRTRSKSSSPRRSRRSGSRGSGSRHRTRRSRSRSPRSSGRARSRSRSPRRPYHQSSRRSASPRRRSRSPCRSRSPRRRSSSPRRPRYVRSSRISSPSPDKKAVDAAVQSFIEASKQKSNPVKKPVKPSSTNGKKVSPKSTGVKGKKPASSTTPLKKTTSSSSTIKKPGSSSAGSRRIITSRKPSSSSSSSIKRFTTSHTSLRKPSSSTPGAKGAVSYSSIKKTYSHPPAKKPITSTPVTSTPVLPDNKDSGAPKGLLYKFKSQICHGTIIHATDLPDDGYTDQDILKIVQPFGKVCDILIIQSKNEAYIETNFREAAAAAVKFSETTPVVIKNKKITLRLAGQKSEAVKHEATNTSAKEKFTQPVTQGVKSAPAPLPKKDVPGTCQTVAKAPENAKKASDDVAQGFVKRYKLAVPIMKLADKCVILISNLPENNCTVEDISNLAKPFGGLKDILLISTHKKAYLQLTNCSCVDSMIKFYTVFPMVLNGNLLSIIVADKFKNLKDENRIFTDIIEQSAFKITPTIYEKFVYLDNLPKKGYTEFEIVCIGLRFGRVEHYAIISNKRKAILHMCTANAAKTMYSFLSRFPCSVAENVLQCSIPSKTRLLEDEYETILEEEKASSETESNVDETEVAQTASEENRKAHVSTKPESTDAVTAPVTASAITCTDEDEPMVVEESAVEQKVEDTPDLPKPEEQVPLTLEEVKEPPAISSVVESVQLDPVVESKEMVCEDLSAQVADEDEDDEEAAEAPEAASSMDSYPESSLAVVEIHPATNLHMLSPEELEVLVSVESECEEEEEASDTESITKSKELDTVGKLETSASEETEAVTKREVVPPSKGTVDSGKDIGSSDLSKDSKSAIDEKSAVSMESLPSKEGSCDVLDKPKESTAENSHQELKTGDVSENQKVEPENAKSGTSEEPSAKGKGSNEKEIKTEPVICLEKINKSVELKPAETSPASTGDAAVKETVSGDQMNTTPSSSVTRTAKYNPQKGEITVTLDSQKSKTDTKKQRSQVERRSSGRDSSTPKSNSNRSSPSETSSNPKLNLSSSQKKVSGKTTFSQQERETKVNPKSRERDVRTSNRKDDRFKSSSSTRYSRNSKTSTRGSKSKEDQEHDAFPFNMDEFVTVDEIVEEQTEVKSAEEKAKAPETSTTPQKAKRKEHEPSSEVKKSKEKSTASQELSFVTLDEIGGEEETTAVPKSSDSSPAVKKLQSPAAERARVKDKQSSKGAQMLLTLDEVSDEDMIQDSDTNPEADVPEDFPKEQHLVTLDEVSEEEEEPSSESEPSNLKAPSLEEKMLTGDTKETITPDITQENPPVNEQAQVDLTEQPLLTLDEVKGDDDDEENAEFIADIVAFDDGHQFLTVDEVGEEEEEASMTSGTNKETTEKSTKQPSKPEKKPVNTEESPVVTPRRGRPRKRPLPAEPTPSPSKLKKVETKAASKGSPEQTAKGTGSKDSKSKTSLTEKKESPTKESAKLSQFNPSVPIGMEFLAPKTGYFCELCSLFYMDNASMAKHCKSLKHYQAVEKHMAKESVSKTEEVTTGD